MSNSVIKLLISFGLLCLVACSSEGDISKSEDIGKDSFGKYKFDECIVKAVIDQERKLTYVEYGRLRRDIPSIVINVIRSDMYPVFQIDSQNSGNLKREYYFFFAALCENKVNFVNSILQDHVLSQKEYEAINYEVLEIVGHELPDGVGSYTGLWVDR